MSIIVVNDSISEFSTSIYLVFSCVSETINRDDNYGLIYFQLRAAIMSSSPLTCSSNIIICGLRNNIRAKHIRLACPPDNRYPDSPSHVFNPSGKPLAH